MTITIWIAPADLYRFNELIKRLESTIVLNSEINDSYLEWDDQPQTGWIQAQISYSSYLRLKEA